MRKLIFIFMALLFVPWENCVLATEKTAIDIYLFSKAYSLLKVPNVTLKRDEFESKKDFEKRNKEFIENNKEKTAPFYIEIPINFWCIPEDKNYNMDTKTFSFYIPMYFSSPYSDLSESRKNKSSIQISKTEINIGSYDGENAFGVRKTVDRIEKEEAYIFILNEKNINKYIVKDVVDYFIKVNIKNIDLDRAKFLKDNYQIVLKVKPEKYKKYGYIHEKIEYKQPTLSSPEQVKSIERTINVSIMEIMIFSSSGELIATQKIQ